MESGEKMTGEGDALLLQVGEKHCALAITDVEGKKVYKLLYCSLDPLMAESLDTFLSAYPETANNFSRVAVSFDFPSASPAPFNSGVTDKSWTVSSYVTGDSATRRVETIPGKNFEMHYFFPDITGRLTEKKFNGGKYWHQYTIALQTIGESEEGILQVDFRPDEFMVTVAAGNSNVLVQTFPYTVPEDVLYYLLKICRHFQLSQQQVQVRLSGLIDEDSALYKGLYQYFLQLSFREAGWVMPSRDYPAHYFTSLNDLARCAL